MPIYGETAARYVQDKATGDVFYVNTWNQEVRWVKPLEMSLFEDKTTPRPGTPDDSTDSEAEFAVDSVSNRFAQRYKKLTKDAARAAEEEAGLLRYVAATQGADMLASAGEWSFVSTDTRLANTKCWYRRSTSEYFWGKVPPLRAAGDVRVSEDVVGDSAKSGGTSTVPRCGFADRAAGEAWLKTQDLSLLMARGEKVRDIGSAGWRQMQAPLPEDALVAVLATASTVSANLPTPTSEGVSGIQVSERVANRKDVISPKEGQQTAVGRDGGVTSFTFFCNAEMGELRWCLSPRSALATPRTPRREAALAKLSEHQHQEQGNELGGVGTDEVSVAGESLAEGDLGNEWEMVEDGDMVFYYNKRLEISSWEPPPGYMQNVHEYRE